MEDIPLVYTIYGNLPVSELTYRHHWIDNDNETTFVEEYLRGDEVVRRSVHTRLKQGAESTAVQATF